MGEELIKWRYFLKVVNLKLIFIVYLGQWHCVKHTKIETYKF